MADYRHLSKAPITEAVIDFQVLFDREVSEADLAKFDPRVIADFPDKKTRHELQLTLATDTSVAAKTVSTAGFLYTSLDGRHVIQCKRNGYSFSRLKPYENWDAFIAAAWGPWEQYRDEFAPKRITKVSTRFINRLTLPDALDFDDYLTIAPRLPPGGPRSLSTFFTVVTIPHTDRKAMVLLRSTFDGASSKENTIDVVLDIDVVSEGKELDPDDSDGIRQAVQDLRGIKNDTFFGSLHDKAVELFI